MVKVCITFYRNPSQNYGAPLVIMESYCLHPTQVNAPRRNPSQTGWYSINLPQSEWKAKLTIVVGYIPK